MVEAESESDAMSITRIVARDLLENIALVYKILIRLGATVITCSKCDLICCSPPSLTWLYPGWRFSVALTSLARLGLRYLELSSGPPSLELE